MRRDHLRRRLRRVLVAGPFCALVIAGACANTDTTINVPTAIGLGVTSVSVDPMNFLGGVPCSNVDGGMGSYVATIIDVSDPKNPFTLPSSPPTPCSQVVYFQNVNPMDSYVAEIDGYVQPADKLVPACGALPPGATVPCTQDSECASAYGCQGSCKVTTYRNLDPGCLTGCAGDAGSSGVACVQACAQNSQHPGLTAAAALSAFTSCVEPVPPDGGPPQNPCGIDTTCFNTNNSCLATQFDALQNDCPSEPPATFDGGVLTGAVKACSCLYVPTEGSRQMYILGEPDAEAPIAPAFQTTCAEGMPAQSVAFTDQPIEPCVPLSNPGTGTTEIAVVPDGTLGALGCWQPPPPDAGPDAAVPSGVATFDVASADGLTSTTPTTGIPCGTNAIVTYASGIVPERKYAFTVTAHEMGGTTATLQACCFAFSQYATTTTAVCDPVVAVDGGADGGDGGLCN